MLSKKIIRSFLFLFPVLLNAQSYYFSNFGVKEGLAQSNVTGVVQDDSGFYWIATAGGVSRFDGKNFINYTTENGLADNNVSAIFKDSKGQLWFGHENGTVTKYDGKNFIKVGSTRFLPKDKKIYGFYQDQSGSLWICTETAGVIRIVNPSGDKSSYQTHTYSGSQGLSQYVLSASEDREGNMWFLTDIGIKIYSKSTRTFDFFRPEGMTGGQVTSLARDHEENFLIGTYNGTILKYFPERKKFETIISGPEIQNVIQGTGPYIIYTMLEDRSGVIWASVLNYGVLRVDKKRGKTTLYNTGNGLAVNKVRSIFEDREGNIIFGTSGEGIEVYSGERFLSYSKKNGLIDDQVWAVCKDSKDRMWFGTNEGITIHDEKAPKEKAYQNYTMAQGLPSNNVRAIVRDGNGNMWVAMWGGHVVKFDGKSSRFVTIPALNDIVNMFAGCLLVDHKNVLWIGTNEGIVRYDLNTMKISTLRTIDGLSDNDISCIFEDSKGNIWIGTKQKGVTVYDGKKFTKYNRSNGLNYNSISSIAEDKKNQIWIGTEGGGAFVFNGKSFLNYKVKDGLASDFITLIAADKGSNIWLGTNKGLNKYLPLGPAFLSYKQRDGFTGVETKPRAVFCEPNGNMWFGTVNGAFKYNPKQDLPTTVKPITKLLRFEVNHEDYPITEDMELSYKENSLSFDFISISLSNPEGVKYQMKLEGFDENWKQLSEQTSEIYSNLPHGKYVFKLIGINSSGIQSEPVIMQITITPPYWKTWWFYLIVFSAIVSGLFTYIKVRERKLRQEKKILEDKVNERTAEVVEKNKELDEINKDITASIRYAKRIQDAILPPDDFVKKHLPNTFILFKPKDIVSGDFYWMEEQNEKVIFAAVDCTGHGVPGAFMSIVGHNLLDRVVSENKITQPAQILDELNRSISDTLRQTNLEDNTVKDGMDIAVCTFHRKTGLLEFAGAYNPLWIIRNNDLIEIKANKFPIGNSRVGETNKFTNHEVTLQKGDCVYIFSDGYSDQFGGPAGKKFKASAFRQLLMSSQHLSMDEQCALLNKTIESWKGNHEQVDDILVIGSRYQ
ncbi:MAG: two-component regulator propeller domain-containing protein [bacterium]|nr:two-component regulator propeller domain-containing protein [bacterium]